MSDFKERLETIEKTVGQQKIDKAKLEERLSNLHSEREKAQKELAEHNIDIDKIDEWLANEEKAINEELKKCESILKQG